MPIRAYDPVGMAQAEQVLADVTYCRPYDCVEGADAAVILTEWESFRALDLERIKNLMTRLVIIDLRNVNHPEDMRKYGFTYVSIGRTPIEQPVNVVEIPARILSLADSR